MASTTNQKAVLPARLKKYCGITWPGWISILVWTPVILILTGLTIHDFIPLLDDYCNENNTAVQIDVKRNEVVDRPNDVTVCLPYPSSALLNIASDLSKAWEQNRSLQCDSSECIAMANHSWDVWNTALFNAPGFGDYYDFRHEIAVAIVKKLLNDSDQFQVLKMESGNSNWNQPIVEAVWYFLASMSRLDAGLISTTDQFNEHVETSKGDPSQNFTEIGLLEDRFREQMYQYGINAISAFFQVLSNTDVNIQETNLTFWRRTFCFQLPLNSSYTYFHFASDLVSKRWKRNKFYFFEDSAVLYVFPQDNFAAVYSTDETKLQQINAEAVSLTYNVESKVIEKRGSKVETCSQTSTPAVCVAEGKYKEVAELCQCIPFALRHFHKNKTNLPYCNISIYETCAKQLDRNNNDLWSKCNEKCSDTIYKWKSDSAVGNFSNSTFYFILEITFKQTSFIEFTLTDKTTLQQFLSQIGGLANLYLGLSGLTVCTILLFCIDNVKRWYRLRTQSESREEDSAPSWQLFQMRTFVTLLQSRHQQREANIGEDQAGQLRNEISGLKEDMVNGQKKIEALSQTIVSVSRNLQTVSEDMQIIKEALAAIADVPRNSNKLSK